MARIGRVGGVVAFDPDLAVFNFHKTLYEVLSGMKGHHHLAGARRKPAHAKESVTGAVTGQHTLPINAVQAEWPEARNQALGLLGGRFRGVENLSDFGDEVEQLLRCFDVGVMFGLAGLLGGPPK